MRPKTNVLILALTAACTLGFSQSARKDHWIGIWHADSGGLPAGTLTLATDTGQLGGTIVLDMLSRDGGQPHVIESEPHVLMSPRIDGNRLSFQVKMKRLNGTAVIASFEVTRIAPDKATIHCMSCGPDAPVVTLMRGQ
jgi:hypothetical protein